MLAQRKVFVIIKRWLHSKRRTTSMKKLLGLFLALTMAWPVSAAVIDNVQAIGEIEVIGSSNNISEEIYNNTTGAASRVMAGLSAELTQDVQANVLFLYDTAWNGATQGKDLNTYQDEITLAEANVVLSNLFDRFELTVGRQFYGEEGSTIMYFGPRHGYIAALAQNPALPVDYMSLDAAKLTYSDDKINVTLLAGKYTPIAIAGAPAANLYSVDFGWHATDALYAQLYGYTLTNMTKLGEDEDLYGYYGAKLTYAPEAYKVSVEYDRAHSGDRLIKESHDNSYLVKVDAALNLNAFTPRAMFYYQKGDPSLLSDFRPGLIFGKTITLVPSESLADTRIFNVGVDYAWNKWTFALDGFSFQDRTAQESSTWEADLTATYQHNENVSLFAGLAYAAKGFALNGLDQQDTTLYQVGMNVKF